MRISDLDKYDCENTLVDDETWDIILEPALREAPALAEALGGLLLCLRKAIESGPEGVTRAANTLMEGIRLVYPYTPAFALSKELWILSLEGDLTPANDPELIVKAALERGRKETVRGRKRRDSGRMKRVSPDSA